MNSVKQGRSYENGSLIVNGEEVWIYRVGNYEHLIGKDLAPRQDYVVTVWFAHNPSGKFQVQANNRKNLVRKLETLDTICRG